MKRVCHLVLLGIATWACGFVAPAHAAGPDARPPKGSIAAQLRLKMSLRAQAEGLPLSAAIQHNRTEWERLSGDQRDDYRKQVLAFLAQDPRKQAEAIKRYDALIKLSAGQRQELRRQAEWLKVVTAAMDEKQRQALLAMTPDERARVLLAKRDEMVSQGLLVLDSPTTAPATAPAPTGH